MSAAHEKAAWVFVPPEAAQETTRDDFTADQKRLANITASLALAGHSVHKLETGFLVSRWGMSKVCPDFASLVGFSRQLGVSP
ncbi:MAG: hypothetical protein CVU24_04230 [Betaproteobacteria bacterium HGW-Betaproteobacteria-18]|nr:MAG: hypothetical protein CVU24_04230 [Betaproteobacteria bacterium HGW-Betaproteobacteria-18]